jgi:hypothetical protein
MYNIRSIYIIMIECVQKKSIIMKTLQIDDSFILHEECVRDFDAPRIPGE